MVKMVSLEKKLREYLMKKLAYNENEVVTKEVLEELGKVADKIRGKKNFLIHHQLETNLAKSFDWNIGYNYGLNKAIDSLKEVLVLLVEGEK